MFDERNGDDGARPPYRGVAHRLDTLGRAAMDGKRREAETLFRRSGITFAGYSAQSTCACAPAGFQHETNSFVATPTTLADFERGGGWPPLVRGAALVERLAPTAPPIAGVRIAGAR